MSIKNYIAGLLVCLTVSSFSTQAETTNCTQISTLPYFINSSGIYCLKSSLTLSSGSTLGVLISANDVVVDLNGFTIDGSAVGVGTSVYGIQSQGRKNITIKNGTLRGFYVGVALGSQNSEDTSDMIENLLIENSTYNGIYSSGKGAINIRNNRIVNTGGSTNSPNAYGMIVTGVGASIVNNQIINTGENSNGDVIAIVAGKPDANPSSSSPMSIENNLISNKTVMANSDGVVLQQNGTKSVLVANHIKNMQRGISCLASALIKDNTVGGATAAFSGCTAAGSTNYTY